MTEPLYDRDMLPVTMAATSDATLENVMMTESGGCKLIDLGMSVHVETLKSQVRARKRRQGRGTTPGE